MLILATIILVLVLITVTSELVTGARFRPGVYYILAPLLAFSIYILYSHI